MSACDPRLVDLRSFPTRRSSDLPVAVPNPRGDLEPQDGQERKQEDDRGGAHQPELLADDREDEIGVGDRKSTRLNSSHRCISYAVFCLKKKRYNQGRSAVSGALP